jgi:hypothetical protein
MIVKFFLKKYMNYPFKSILFGVSEIINFDLKWIIIIKWQTNMKMIGISLGGDYFQFGSVFIKKSN